MTTEALRNAMMASRIKITTTDAAGDVFTCYPVDAAQADAWERKYRAMGRTVVRQSPEQRA